MEFHKYGEWTICNVLLNGKEGHELFKKDQFIGRFDSYELAKAKWKELTG